MQNNEEFLVDSHCHLLFSHFKSVLPRGDASSDFDEKYAVDAVIKRAVDANVKYMLLIGTELSDVSELRDISDKYDNVFRTVGIHPLEAAKHHQLYSFDEISGAIRDNCKHVKSVGIGEIGLDYHYERESKNQQKEIFNLQLGLAKECDLPVSIHSREASDDVADILKDHPSVKGVIHCFSGEKRFAEKVLDMGFYISISGTITYKNAIELRNSLKYIPLDRLLIETDSPFLTPDSFPETPGLFRKKVNEPAFVAHVAKGISERLDVPLQEVMYHSSKNFFELFSKAAAYINR
jgi:TatD DNase family protein